MLRRTLEDHCRYWVFGNSRMVRGSQCSRKWKVEREGSFWCTQHDPERVRRVNKERHDQWKTKWDAIDASRKIVYVRERAVREACEGVSNEMLPMGIVRKLIDYVYEMDYQPLIQEIEGISPVSPPQSTN